MLTMNNFGPMGGSGGAGFQGVTGPIGPKGVQGLDGAFAAQGVQGFEGFQGAFGGPTGPAGATGDTGFQGLSGASGTNGTQGFKGFQGSTGTGFQGTSGNTGVQGFKGFQGSIGITGATGVQGDVGFQGDIGATGATGNQSLYTYQTCDTSGYETWVTATGEGITTSFSQDGSYTFTMTNPTDVHALSLTMHIPSGYRNPGKNYSVQIVYGNNGYEGTNTSEATRKSPVFQAWNSGTHSRDTTAVTLGEYNVTPDVNFDRAFINCPAIGLILSMSF